MFDKEKISELFPGAEDLMIQPMLIWTLPSNKKDKLSEVCASGEYFAEEKLFLDRTYAVITVKTMFVKVPKKTT